MKPPFDLDNFTGCKTCENSPALFMGWSDMGIHFEVRCVRCSDTTHGFDLSKEVELDENKLRMVREGLAYHWNKSQSGLSNKEYRDFNLNKALEEHFALLEK